MKNILFILLFLLFSPGIFAGSDDGCTAEKKQGMCKLDLIKERVDWACKLVEAKGKDAFIDINSMRFDCCGEPNYVFVFDMNGINLLHPLKPDLDGRDRKGEKDPDGKMFIDEFLVVAKKSPSGGWVDYKWVKFGEVKPAPKSSWVKTCNLPKSGGQWIVDSGTWK